MARGALTGSLVVHALALAGIAAVLGSRHDVAGGGRLARDASPVSIEVLGAAHAAPSTPPGGLAAATPGGGAATLPAHAAMRATTAIAQRRAPSRSGTGRSPDIVETTVRIEPADSSGGGGAASGGGAVSGGGAGRGNGIGFGTGGGIALPVDTARLATPEPPRRSLARPPRLRWPLREVEIGDRPLFVAHITVGDDGLVSRARLVHGAGGRANDRAADLIWLFRYDPALDDDGHPIPADIDQSFLVR